MAGRAYAEHAVDGRHPHRRVHGQGPCLPKNLSVRLEPNGADEGLVLTGLDRLEEPASLVALRNAVSSCRATAARHNQELGIRTNR